MASYLIKGGFVVDPSQGIEETTDILIENGKIVKIEKNIRTTEAVHIIDVSDLIVSPGFIDIHTHLRDPGYEWKEDIESGSYCAVAGGITSICCMANTDPVNDNPSVTRYIIEKAKEVAVCNVFPIGALTKGLKGEEIAEIGQLKEAGVVALSDDGNVVKDTKVLRNAFDYAKSFGLPVFCHSEDKMLSDGGHMNEGYWSTILGIPGMPKEAETIGTLRDIMVAKLTGAKIHICHVSTKEALKAIEKAKREGVKVTCEITPHHFTLTDENVKTFDTNYKMAPPLRDDEDVTACKEALKSGIADVIATDHAPHSTDEKMVEFTLAPFGILGFPTLLPLSLNLVREGYLTLSDMIRKLTSEPAKIINKPSLGTIKPGAEANITIFDKDEEFTLTEDKIFSKSKNTPFLNRKLIGKVKITIYNGKIVYKDF